jgi:CMP-N-acetylneuraminic acid synthetase
VTDEAPPSGHQQWTLEENKGTEIIGFVPCRAGSERVLNKNTHPFADFEGGLLELKLRQLAQVPELCRIIVSTNDPAVLEYSPGSATRWMRVSTLCRGPKVWSFEHLDG